MFKKYDGPDLTIENVITELEKIQNLGWEIFVKEGLYEQHYIIKPDDNMLINIYLVDNKWYIESYCGGGLKYIKFALTLEAFINVLNEAAAQIDINLSLTKRNDTFRLKQTQPASNKSKFLDLIHSRAVTDIFDPYFDTKSINTLLSLGRLGLKLNSQIRCLTTSKTIKKIDKTFLQDFNNEFGVNLQIRVCSSDKEHRRFLILNDNKIIIIGCSLNDINKNEILLEETSQDDIDFFNLEWTSGTTCT
jgi:hypothetical protein